MTTLPSREPFDASWYESAYPDVREIGMDPYEHYTKYGELLGRRPSPVVRQLKRIVLVVPDLSTIGGMASRTRTVLAYGKQREIEYVTITARAANGGRHDGEYCFGVNPSEFTRVMNSWLPSDTVMVVSNNAVRAFPAAVRSHIQRFPIIYICAGQMAFMLQDSMILKDRKYATEFRAMGIMSFSDGDINFQRQLGIHGQVKGFAPVAQREINNYNLLKNRRLGYVGRIDFHAKDSGRLIDIARALEGSKWGPIKLYTTDGQNSPDYEKFLKMISDNDLESEFEIVLNQRDKAEMFDDLALLLVPSKKESFGNSVVESLSFGVPVLAASYAPGPAEIIEHRKSGFLLDDYSGDSVASLLAGLTQERLEQASEYAFERHKVYRADRHVEQIEQMGREAVESFLGENVLPVLPRLKILDG